MLFSTLTAGMAPRISFAAAGKMTLAIHQNTSAGAGYRKSLEGWAREEDRSIGSLLRRLVEKSVRERRGERTGGDAGACAA